MGKLSLSLAFVGAAACGSNNNTPIDAHIKLIDAAPDAPKVFMDAPPPMFDLSCIGNNPPTVAAQVTIAGAVSEVSLGGIVALSGATVDACTGNCMGGNKLDTQTSSGTGTFTTIPLPTGGNPINGYIRMTHANDRTTLAYSHAPIAQSLTGVPVLTFQTTLVPLLSNFGCTQNDAANGMIGLVVNDCAGARISDANLAITIKQGATTVGDPPFDVGAATGQAAANGFFLICNVPEGTTSVTAKYNNMALLSHDVGITKGTTTETETRPGY